jgi:hypothetical protein
MPFNRGDRVKIIDRPTDNPEDDTITCGKVVAVNPDGTLQVATTDRLSFMPDSYNCEKLDPESHNPN